jgi:hypothetical protein
MISAVAYISAISLYLSPLVCNNDADEFKNGQQHESIQDSRQAIQSARMPQNKAATNCGLFLASFSQRWKKVPGW